MPPGFAGSGTLETTEVTLSSLTSGKILTLSKEEGDRVKKDELLATIDVEKIRLQRDQMNASFSELDANKISADAAVSQAKDNLENIRLKYNRMKELVEKGSTTQQQFDDISTQLRLAESQLTAAQSQISMIES
ncbi:MAG: biotin/lipoyl-binding protein, partial [Candidatus Aureabacteria bacterium]|nr:biotin/lipoyl-binding protein [Candidatus Auribacterota bacterium]